MQRRFSRRVARAPMPGDGRFTRPLAAAVLLLSAPKIGGASLLRRLLAMVPNDMHFCLMITIMPRSTLTYSAPREPPRSATSPIFAALRATPPASPMSILFSRRSCCLGASRPPRPARPILMAPMPRVASISGAMPEEASRMQPGQLAHCRCRATRAGPPHAGRSPNVRAARCQARAQLAHARRRQPLPDRVGVAVPPAGLYSAEGCVGSRGRQKDTLYYTFAYTRCRSRQQSCFRLPQKVAIRARPTMQRARKDVDAA